MSLPFNGSETSLMLEALYELRGIKEQAMNTLNDALPARKWTPNDFGIPTIMKLIKQLEDHDETIDI